MQFPELFGGRRRSAAFGLLVIAIFGLAATGCLKPPVPTLREEQRGLVYIFPGIGNDPWIYQGVYDAFRDAGIDAAIHIEEWDSPFYNALGHLIEHQVNVAHAQRVAAKLADYRREEPNACIDLVGYSAGGGIAILVAAALPPNVRVRNIVLVQPAISPTCDLTSVLRRVDGRLVNLYSPCDVLVLGLGTYAFGTVDRVYGLSAGLDGFDVDAAVPEANLRPKLIQKSWTPRMILSGHLGSHFWILGYEWNRKYVAPYVAAAADGQPEASRPAAGGNGAENGKRDGIP